MNKTLLLMEGHNSGELLEAPEVDLEVRKQNAETRANSVQKALLRKGILATYHYVPYQDGYSMGISKIKGVEGVIVKIAFPYSEKFINVMIDIKGIRDRGDRVEASDLIVNVARDMKSYIQKQQASGTEYSLFFDYKTIYVIRYLERILLPLKGMFDRE